MADSGGVGVTLINTNGMAFIGPGSEWFWTAVSGLVLAVTFFAIYRQLRLQRSQAAIEHVESISREWLSERWARIRLECLTAYRDVEDPADIDTPMASLIVAYWDRVATLVRGGHIERRLVLELEAGGCEDWWVMLRPSIQRYRAQVSEPMAFENFEWLAEASAARTRQARGSAVDEASVRAAVDDRIASNRELIRIEQALRAVTIVTPETEPKENHAAAAPPAPVRTVPVPAQGRGATAG
jgi:hypothetical protein